MSPRSAEELGRDVTVAEVLPSVERHLATYLAWAPYDADAGLRAPTRARPRAPRESTPACRTARRAPDPSPREGCGAPVAIVIETAGLRKEFRTRRGGLRVAVQNLDLAVPAGGVHGFLGPNGSGKTTTIRMLLGLARATRGSMALFGADGARTACPT